MKTRPKTDPSPVILLLPLFLGLFAFYLLHLSPCFLDDDSPETVTAAVTLGLQHPPGYPLAAMVQHCFSLIHLGNPCFAVNLGSAFLGALTVFLLALLLRQTLPTSAGLSPILTGALLLAFSRSFWEKALGAKGFIYLSGLALILALALCLEKDRTKPGRRRWALLACFLFGLGFVGHWQTLLLFSPLLAAFLWRPTGSGRSFRFPKTKSLLIGGALFVTALSPLLYLPLRAHLHPWLNMGAPDTFPFFLKDLSRGYFAYRETGLLPLFFQALFGHAAWGQWTSLLARITDIQLRQIPLHFWQEMQLPALLLAVGGFWTWFRRGEKRLVAAWTLSVALLLLALGSASWIIPGPQALWYADNYLLPLNAWVAWGAALGLVALLGQPKFRKWTALSWLLPFFLFWSNTGQLDLQRQTLRYDYGMNLLKSLPAGALFFAEGDEDYFTLDYLQGVAGLRPDVRAITTFTLFEPWGVAQVERFHPELGLTLDPYSSPDPYHRIGSALEEIMAKDQAPCGFSYFNGAFHRYYLTQKPDHPFQRSGNLLLIGSSLPPKTQVLGTHGLRLRHWGEPSSQHPSLRGIQEVYRLSGAFP